MTDLQKYIQFDVVDHIDTPMDLLHYVQAWQDEQVKTIEEAQLILDTVLRSLKKLTSLPS